MSDNEENDDGESVATNTTTNTTATFSLEDIRDLLNQPNALQQLLQNATAGASNPSQDLLNRITSLEQQRGASNCSATPYPVDGTKGGATQNHQEKWHQHHRNNQRHKILRRPDQ